MRRTLERADALVRRTGVSAPAGTRIFLTTGGWRWRFLALTSQDAFAFARPISTVVADAIVIQRADPAADMAFNGNSVDGRRRLSGVIAHERTHILMDRTLGYLDRFSRPNWQTEGYADYIAQESSLTPEDYARLTRAGVAHPALVYFEGRQRIENMARNNGGTIAAMFLPGAT
jgi:hypothetical protein